ncbi:hypothetical protein [Tropicibacter sp. Alg240-R139]|uniref:hypothetical protein n=1 Tax=Tropicibacter sp. Alg240-R139 TaxID=2305991 RepID=UPI0013DFCE74|nr:hypothetical protein [Tropicibacter sp. Alg240-R139]
MAHHIDIQNDTITRRDYADHAAGQQQRDHIRAMIDNGGTPDGNSPWNEAFNFTQDEYDLVMKLHPELNDPDPQRRAIAWRAFAQSSEGQFFRVR